MVLGLIAVSDADTDYQLDLLLSEARGWDDVAVGVWSLASSLLSLEQEAGNDEAPAFFRRICRHIDTRYAESLTLTDLCEAFRISRPYMYKLFRKFEGTSFNEYLTRRRIEAAKRLIAESPSMPLKDVAQYVGYQDQFYFSRVFKSLTGIPPSEYR
jgi:YesN/AraC family two-component response regulator